MLARFRGFPSIIAATAAAGIAGYLVTWLVYREIGQASYAAFAVFWAAIYLVVGGLSGIQQEITRATHPIELGSSAVASRARNFGIGLAALVFVLIVASAPLWAAQVFPQEPWQLVWPLAVGAAAYVLVATLSGALYGVSRWGSLAMLIAADGIFRLALFLVGLALTEDVVILAWLVALPFPLVIALLWPLIRRGFVGRTALDVGYGPLAWNVSRTILAAASTAVLVSGFPLLLGVAADGVDPAVLGELIFTITLTRAPLIVSIMSLQSYFVVRFKEGAAGAAGLMGRVVAGVLALGIVLGALGWWLGPAVMQLVSGDAARFGGDVIAILVGSSALIAALSVSGAAILARGNHFVYSLGWLVAAIATVGMLMTPVEFMVRVLCAALIAPIAGLIVHCTWLVVDRRSPVGGQA